ncbi:hypothetical protein EJB05_06305, partial [Eragrostis curvula]
AEVGNAEAEATKLVRVSTVWRLAETGPVFQYNEGRKHKLQDTCLGLGLFKLLRHKMERQPMAEAGTAQALNFVRRGLLEELGAERAFEVMEQELTFLDEYYQAIIPLALPKPELFFANFAFSLIFILIYVVAVMLVTGNGHIFHVLVSLFRGLVDLSTDMVLQYKCFVHQASFLLSMVLSSCDLIVTFLFTFTFLAVETYEFVQYLISDWHLVSLLCNYARKPALRRLARVQRTIKVALWFRVRTHRIKVHQLTLLRLCQVHPCQAKEAIVKVLNEVLDRIADKRRVRDQEANGNGNGIDEGSCFSNGRDALRRSAFSHL